MPTYNIREARMHLSRLLKDAAAGKEVFIAKAGKPMAKLVPIAEGDKPLRKLGLLAGKMTIKDDFDDPLPEDILESFYGPLFPD